MVCIFETQQTSQIKHLATCKGGAKTNMVEATSKNQVRNMLLNLLFFFYQLKHIHHNIQYKYIRVYINEHIYTHVIYVMWTIYIYTYICRAKLHSPLARSSDETCASEVAQH